MNGPRLGWRHYALLANVVALVLIVAVVLANAYPSTETARMRNALLLRASAPTDFAWTPDRPPAGFKGEKHQPNPEYAAIARELGLSAMTSDWDRARAIAAHLTRNATDGGAVQRDLNTTYDAIVHQGRGYCVDFTTVFMGLALTAGIPVRQWAFSFDGFGGDGHAFVEIYEKQRGKWLFLDVYNNFYAVDRASGEPLSALEFREAIRGARAPAAMIPIGPGRPGFAIAEKAWAYYSRGLPEWYLWFGNDVFTYDEQPLLRALGHVSRIGQQAAAISMGLYPTIRVLETDANVEQLRRLERLRMLLWGALALCTVLAVLLVVQLYYFLKGRSNRARTPPAPMLDRPASRVP